MALSRRTGQRFQASIWPGFVDAMTGLLLVLMFVLTIFMIVQFVLSETITGQETELDALESEVAALADALGLERTRTRELEGELGGLQATLTDTQAALVERDALIASLTATRDRQAIELEAARTEITSFEAQVAALLADREKALGDIAALEGERDTLIDERDALNLALVQARGEIDAQVEAARLAAAEADAMQALIESLRKDVSEGEAQIADLEGQLSDEERARLLEAAAAEELRNRLEDADAELTAMTLALEQQRQEAEDTLTLLAAAKAAQEDLEVKLAAALVEGEAAGADLAETILKLAAVETELETRDGELASVKAELAAALLSVETSKTTVAELLAQVANAEAEKAGAEAQAASDLAALEARLAEALEAKLAEETRASEAEAARDGLQDVVATLEEQLAAAVAAQVKAEENGSSLRERLATALAAKLAAENALGDTGDVREQLAAALAAQRAAELAQDEAMTEAERRDALLAEANKALSEEEAKSAESLRKVEALNQQIAALRTQLGSLQALLDDYAERDAASKVQLEALGSDLNAALARAAAEERKRRLLEEAERARLEAEKADLEARTQDLAQYRSEFFGRLRSLLGAQEGVRIVGDRFVFSSEVLFDVGAAGLSPEGERELAKVAAILQSVIDDIPAEINWILRVDGHTDNLPIYGGQFADNWELSQARALSVVRYMIDELGLPPDRLSANGFGEYQPVDTANTAEARAKNRRIELKFTEK
ncbi:chemotaxis protein MotB [Shimia isoporae]|uniref:Chemotaxis protein MotB n=1 Tax=Shimia isoporae TaxID=647720 RepID=A0A4R1NIS0_9RHOB|nr:peptidoglycan -binding protein [Shimia isoporae]TCL08127.1 chemotaxis protein MotB [Shimia isoporae]